MNHIYRSIWSDALGTWVAVAEHTKSKGKRSTTRNTLLATGLLCCTPISWALPTGEQLVAGQATVNTPTVNQMQIQQTSQQAIINWQGFSVAQGEAVNIQQPNANAALLNRVVGQDASQIQGQLNANGQVYLVNPNGVVFGKNAQVDVGGLVASTHNISDADFLNGKNHFTQNGATGSIDNQGTIKTPDGGVIALISQNISNTGSITAPKGTAIFAAGKTVDLDFQGNGLVEVKVPEAALNAQITNKGAIQADGGRVVLTAKAAGQLIDTVINQQGIIRAQSMIERNGEIILDGGDNGITQVGGSLDVSGNNNNEKGGRIVVTGDKVLLQNTTNLNATGNTGGGDILVGGSWQGKDPNIRQATATIIEKGAKLDASATNKGNGGTVVAWSDTQKANSVTRAYGTFLAKGGVNGGDGGSIETSGHWLDVEGITVDAQAHKGQSGNWLLDPNDISINAVASVPLSIAGGPNWLTNNDSSILPPNSILSALNLGTSVTATTASAGLNTQLGNITVASNITKTAGGNATLSLFAANNIIFVSNISISSTSGALNVILNADKDNSGAGNIQIGQGFGSSSIVSNGGNIVLGGGRSCTLTGCSGYATGQISSANKGISLNNAILDAQGGNISLQGQGSSTVSSNNFGVDIFGGSIVRTIGTGSISIDGVGSGSGAANWGVNLDGTGTSVSTVDGAISILGQGSTGGDYNNYGIYLNSANISSTGVGAISLQGTGGNSSTGTSTGGEHGVFITSTGSVQANNGAININGIAGSSLSGANIGSVISGNVTSTGSGTITINGIGAGSGEGLNIVGKIGWSGTGPIPTGDIILSAGGGATATDSILLFLGNKIQSSGNLSLFPSNGTDSIGLAGGVGLFNLDSAELSYIQPGFSSITIGSTTGNINVGTATAGWTLPTGSNLLTLKNTGGGNIVLDGAISNPSSITLNAGNSIIDNGIINSSGALNLLAGNNISLNSSINTNNNNFTALAGISGLGTPSITLNSGATINTGAGQATLAAINGDFINNSGSIAPINASQFFIYAADPRTSARNGMVYDFKHYGQAYTGVTPSYASTGNWFFYGVTPVLTITPLPTIAYGSLPASFPYTITGFIDDDTAQTAGIFGSPFFDVANFTGASGNYNVNFLGGLASSLGYVFTNDVNANNALTFIKSLIPTIKPITLSSLLPQIAPLQKQGSFLSWYLSILQSDKLGEEYADNLPSSDISVNDANSKFSGNDNALTRFITELAEEKKPVLPVLQIKNSAGQVKRLKMSKDRQFLSLLLEDGSVRIWDFQSGMQRQIDPQDTKQVITDLTAVDDKGEALSIASKEKFGLYDVTSLTTNEQEANPEADIQHFTRTDDGKLLLLNFGSDGLKLWDNKRNQAVWQTQNQRGTVSNLAVSHDKHHGAVLSTQPGVYEVTTVGTKNSKPLTDALDIIDLSTGKVIKSLPNLGEQVIHLHFKDDDILQIGLASGKLLDWSLSTGKKTTVANFPESVIALDNDKDTYAYVSKNGGVRVGDGQEHIHLSIENKTNPFKYVQLIDEGKKLLTVLASGDLSLWDVESGQKMLRLFSSKRGWTVMDALGRFDGSEDAMENFSWLAKDEDIPLDKFSESYYEPGLLNNVIQNQDYLNHEPDSVAEGISLPPKIDVQLAEQQNKGDKVALQMDVYNRGGGIDKVHVYHNGKIITDPQIADENTEQPDSDQHLASTFNITPTDGKNTLKVVASNDMGIENSSQELSFDGKSKAYTSSVRLLTVGINQYSDPQLNLNYSVADANSIEQAIKNQSKVSASQHLIDEKATKPQILAELRKLSQGAQQDSLIIYFAGHGIAVDKEWYFLPYETKLQPTPEKIAATGITATELGDIFKDSKIQHIMLVVDSCYSGAGVDAFKFKKLENNQRYFARKMSRTMGITVIAATSKDQEASELESLGHGLFTYALTEELQKKNKDAPLTAHNIADSIVKTLPAFSKKMLGFTQDPVVFTKGSDFTLGDTGNNKK